MNQWEAFRIALVVCLGMGWLWPTQAEPTLRLVKRIPLSEIVNDQEEPLNCGDIFGRGDPMFLLSTNQPWQGYGFIKGGKAFTPGWGGWVLDIETGDWKREFPASLRQVSVTKDGTMLYGRYKKSVQFYDVSFGMDTISGEPRYIGMMMHPDNMAEVDAGWGKTTNNWFEEVSIGGVQVPLKGKYLSSVNGFTGNGRYLVVDGRQLIDAKTMRLLPVDPEMVEAGKPSENYIGDSEIFVFNRDASWVAGFSSAFDTDDRQIALYVWDRKDNHFVWKGRTYGAPVSFSPNDAYLLTRAGYILSSKTGEVAIQGLAGKNGKFSPDGRSVVTVDEEAFYIYTLPKDSEPIFGVFQKPEPWSPPRSKKLVKTPPKKNVKKP